MTGHSRTLVVLAAVSLFAAACGDNGNSNDNEGSRRTPTPGVTAGRTSTPATDGFTATPSTATTPQPIPCPLRVTYIANGPTYTTMIRDLATERSMLELYDVQEDPAEQCNLANTPAHAAEVADLGRQLRAWMQETEDPLLRGPIPSPFYHEAIRTLQGF